MVWPVKRIIMGLFPNRAKSRNTSRVLLVCTGTNAETTKMAISWRRGARLTSHDLATRHKLANAVLAATTARPNAFRALKRLHPDRYGSSESKQLACRYSSAALGLRPASW